MNKGRKIMAMILHLLVIGGVAFSVLNLMFGWLGNIEKAEILNLLEYYTIDSNLFLAFTSLLMVIGEIVALATKKSCKFLTVLQLMAVTGVTITGVVTIAYLGPVNGNWDYLYDFGSTLYLHAVIPVLAIAAFIIDNKPRLGWPFAFLGILVPVAYGGVMVPLINFGTGFVDHYGFMTIKQDKIWENIAWIGGMLVGAFLVALILVLLHNIGSRKGENVQPVEEPKLVEEPKPVEEPQPVEEPAPVEEPQAVEEPKSEEEAKPADEAPKAEKAQPVARPRVRIGVRTYHISKQRASGRWQIKLANSEKVIRVFATQAEAIAYAKGLVESQGGSYRIHSVKGKIRR